MTEADVRTPVRSAHPDLELAAARARRNVLRMFESTPAGHLGGAMSAIDIVTALYGRVLRIDPANPLDPARDRFLLSAGHKAMCQYAVLADLGFFDASILDTYGRLDTPLGGHPDMHKLTGVEANTGALGHGLAIAAGIAMGARMQGLPTRVWTLLGDGELPEGSNWEAAAIAAHHGLDGLTAVVDVNGMQISGTTAEVMDMEPIVDKLLAFGWEVQEVDGHDLDELVPALQARSDRPRAIVAHTIKGLGVRSVQGTVAAHYWKPTADELAIAVADADADVASLSEVLA